MWGISVGIVAESSEIAAGTYTSSIRNALKSWLAAALAELSVIYEIPLTWRTASDLEWYLDSWYTLPKTLNENPKWLAGAPYKGVTMYSEISKNYAFDDWKKPYPGYTVREFKSILTAAQGIVDSWSDSDRPTDRFS